MNVTNPSSVLGNNSTGYPEEIESINKNLRVAAKSSARSFTPITPHDTNEIAFDAIWVGVGGDIAIKAIDDSTSNIIPNVPGGWFAAVPLVVLATGTTATDLFGVTW